MKSDAANQGDAFFVGEIQFIPAHNQIQYEGQTIQLRSGLMKLLTYLIQRQNQVITKEDLLDNVWDGRIVSFDSIARSISDLRKFLKEQFGNTFEIITIPKVGYKLRYEPPIPTPSKISPSAKNVPTTKWIKYLPYILLAGLILSWGNYFFQTQTPVVPISKPSELTYTTALVGEEVTPALSKDGQHQAFSWRKDESESYKIYVQALTANLPRPFTKGEGDDIYPRWLKDGNTILFHRWLPNGKRLLMKASLLSNDETLITELPFIDTDGYYTASEDGTRYFFSGLKDYSTNHSIYQYSTLTKKFEKLVDTPTGIYGDTYPVFIEEKNAVLFSRSSNVSTDLFEDPDAQHHLFIYYLESKELDILGSFPYVINGLDWMKDKEAALIWLRKSYTNDLLMIDLNKKQTVLKFNVPTVSRNLSYSSETGSILYEVWQGETGIYENTITKDTLLSTNEKRIYGSTRSERSIAFSNNGNHLLFNSTRTGFLELWQAEIENELSLKKITNNGNESGLPWFSISNTGDSILCVFTNKLVLLDRLGNELQQIIPEKGKIVSPVWSLENANVIYFSSNETGRFESYEYDLITKTKKVMITGGSYRILPTLENGKEILYFSRFKSRGIWKTSSRNKEVISALPSTALNDFINWYPSKNGIYFIRWEGGQSVLYFHHFETKRYTRLKQVDDIIPGFPSLHLSPDNEKLYLTKAGGINADIVIEQLFN